MKTDSMSNQLRWVILLLAAAVILPTVCLLWFMNQAVKNERLAFRQKLVEIYEKKATTLFVDHSNELWKKLHQNINDANMLPDSIWHTLTFLPSDITPDGFLIYDKDGNLAYPVITDTYENTPESLEDIWQMEFMSNNFEDSLKEYTQIADNAQTESLHYKAKMAVARCLLKLDRHEEAKLLYQSIAYPKTEIASSAIHAIRSRIMLTKLYAETNDPSLSLHLSRSLKELIDPNENTVFLMLPSDTKIWAFNKLIEIAQDAKLDESLKMEIEKAQTAIIKEEHTLKAADAFPSTDSIIDWPQATLRKLESTCCLYGIYFKVADKTILCLFRYEELASLFEDAIKDIEESSARCSVHDSKGSILASTDKLGEHFLSLPMGTYMPDWDITLFFDPLFLLNAPIKQAAYYTWGGIFSIIIISIIGITAIQVVSKQMKMNRLKNDFIATVTHELKTPLASMRVLVDTLLEGNYEGEQTATEYLQLVANENKRLTHLIDSFLTFSRMERNKQVFEIASVSPVEVVNMATEAVRTKFDSEHVKFNIDVRKPLSMIHADKDGMVTVLVNLLDNACKYSLDEKIITLNVFAENDFVCFAVKDNGIGLSPRARRKIFNRFYQVDDRLSRRAEGCGLGLSIVKFIIDAHKGTIEVESETGTGSIFTVKLPSI